MIAKASQLMRAVFSSQIETSMYADQIISLLDLRLNDTISLYHQTRYINTIVCAPDLDRFHQLLDELSLQLSVYTQACIDHLHSLGYVYYNDFRLDDYTIEVSEYIVDAAHCETNIENLISHFAQYSIHMHDAIDTAMRLDSQQCADLFTEIARETDKALLYLEAHLPS